MDVATVQQFKTQDLQLESIALVAEHVLSGIMIHLINKGHMNHTEAQAILSDVLARLRQQSTQPTRGLAMREIIYNRVANEANS